LRAINGPSARDETTAPAGVLRAVNGSARAVGTLGRMSIDGPTVARLSSSASSRTGAPTLVEALERGAAADAPLLTLHGSGAPKRFGARDALACARRWATLYTEHGVRRGDPVGILLPTSTDFVGALAGAMLLGAVPLPLPAPMTFGPMDRYLEHLGRVVTHAGARVLATSPRVAAALEALPLRGHLGAVLVPAAADGTTARAVGPDSLDGTDTALLQYTSGTTGRPKGVRVSHRALATNAAAIADGFGLTDADVGVSWLPMYHDMGLVGVLLTAIAHPYALHVMPPEAFIMKPRRWLELVSTYRGTISTAPNFAYEHAVKRADASGLDLSSWRAALNGAEPVHASTVERFHARFGAAGLAPHAITPVYGLAEATLAVTFHPRSTPVDVLSVDRGALDAERVVRPGVGATARSVVGVGVPVAGTTVMIADGEGRARQMGEVGEILVRGPGLMDGYHRDEEASARALRDGWLRTGDLGFVSDGRLYVSGRARELIIQAGRNVHPEDVEEVALGIDARVGTAAAFARPSEERGTDELVLVLEARGVEATERDELAERVRGEILAAIGVRTDEVAFWPLGSIPRTSSGKVRRSECAARYGAERPRPEAP
jgi:acyl-CoA synthetase (AMP-forming)/AMP-acid ligase II